MGDLCNILIVDDELLVRQGIRHHLNWEQHGFRIIGEAANGKEALEMVGRLHPHIVITDIVMPVMDGEQLTRVLKAHYPHIEVIVLSSYGEFQYVRSTFQSGVADYILKPKLETDELLKVLIDTARKIPGVEAGAEAVSAPGESIIANPSGGATVRGRSLSSAEEQELLVNRQLERMLAGYASDEANRQLLEAYFPHDGYVIFGADLTRVAGDRHRYVAILTRSVKEHLQREGLSEHVMSKELNGPEHDQQLVILVNIPRAHDEIVRRAARKLADETGESMPGIVWAVSEGFMNIERLPQVYREEWMQLLKYRFYFPERTLMMSGVLPPESAAPQIDMNVLLEDMRRKNISAAFARIRQYVEKAVKHYVMPPFEFKSQLGNFVFHIAIGLSESSGRNEQVKKLDTMKYVHFKAIDEAKDAFAAAEALEAFLQEAEELSSSAFPEDSNMQKLLAYIDEHYSEPLRLSSLGEHFHFNPSYLSGYFSAHHSEGFSEYLNKTRITKACELLSSDELSISEISAKVGYADHSYFTKVFKKHTGLSPSQYRRQTRSTNAAGKRE